MCDKNGHTSISSFYFLKILDIIVIGSLAKLNGDIKATILFLFINHPCPFCAALLWDKQAVEFAWKIHMTISILQYISFMRNKVSSQIISMENIM